MDCTCNLLPSATVNEFAISEWIFEIKKEKNVCFVFIFYPFGFLSHERGILW